MFYQHFTGRSNSCFAVEWDFRILTILTITIYKNHRFDKQWSFYRPQRVYIKYKFTNHSMPAQECRSILQGRVGSPTGHPELLLPSLKAKPVLICHPSTKAKLQSITSYTSYSPSHRTAMSMARSTLSQIQSDHFWRLESIENEDEILVGRSSSFHTMISLRTHPSKQSLQEG